MTLVLSSRILALPAALIAGVLLALVILRLGRRRFSPRLLGVAIACGAIVAFLPAAIDLLQGRFNLGLSPFWDAAFKAFVLAGVGEEGAKLAAAYFFVRPSTLNRTSRDLVLGVVAVALGFALLENVLYVFAAADRWPATALTRMVTAVPIHALIGFVLGGGLARALAAPAGATRMLLVARAWAVAALLHGSYDFPLLLAARAPLYPTPVNNFALAFSTTTPTLLSALYLAAVLAACLGAARVIFGLQTGGDAPDADARRLWPNWLHRFVFARATGLVVGGMLLFPATIWVGLAVNATIAGVMPLLTLNALSVSAATAMLGALLLLRAAPPAADAAPLSRKRRLFACGALAAAVAALVVFGGALETGRRNLIAYALVMSSGAYSSQGDLERAMANDDAALGYRPDFVAALVQRAIVNKTYQRYQRALDDLNSAARLAPDDPAILGERANAFENLHQVDNALGDLDRALAVRPDDPALLFTRAEILTDKGAFDKAAADLDRALRLKPDLALAHAGRGDLFLRQDDYDDAARELSEAIRIDPNFATPYFTRGRIRYFQGQFPAAIADLQQSNGRQQDAYSALWLYLARGRANQNGRDELIFWASRLSRNAWPFPMIEFYLGARSAPSAFAAAANADQVCEADFYIAEWLVLQKLEQLAVARLRRAAATCPKSFIEYGGAVAELNRLAPGTAPAGAGEARPDAGQSPPLSDPPAPTSAPAGSQKPLGAGATPARPSPGGDGGAASAVPPLARSAGAMLTSAGSVVYEGSANWRRIAQDDSVPRLSALALQIDFPKLPVKFFITLEKARDDDPTPRFALKLAMVRPAPPAKSAAFRVTRYIGAPSVIGGDHAGPLQLASAILPVFGDFFQASVASDDIAFDLTALQKGARLDIPLAALADGNRSETRFDLIVDIDDAAADGARELARLWLQPAPPAGAPNSVAPDAPTPPVAAGGAAAGKAEPGADAGAPARTPTADAGQNAGSGQQAAALDASAAAQHLRQGETQRAQGQFDGAVAEYRAAVRLDPANADAHRDLGAVLRQQGLLEDAATELREALRLKPDGAAAHQILGDIRLDQDSFDDAIAEYREASRLAPDEATPHRLLGAALLEAARRRSDDQQVALLRQACDELMQGAQLAPSDPNLPILMGVVEAALAARGHCPAN